MFDNDDQVRFSVVVNLEEQYSIWPEDRPLPPGWRAEGKSGTRQACLDYIGEVWTDMRPLSLRRWMQDHSRES
ncbi:MbtH family protein [Burkholderia ubonensis]|uniref:Antibiotic synthesis protein MbtH n=1 Tax=Burkholderia ubonensis TaxID=101571 RepID=A0AAW3MP99_9BURK|nr:MbtH family NRPS accessory protein [Burkholderia ubonensis]KVL13221.1 antibiotic synthesis protein MbtH [Burkholderia ubonensis]KVO42606.1 antibiotic synthesis protein MbtH [Burkholderia ubonensis]KVP94080.1 antibiotic synthesis protein MbtH [Burkholderia ubonensis]KVQ49526.1 antibiotic synthesis protein MbtH [Burkholderia ubonensis]KVX25300.1 antibiotic synthesis protein MbtH [Burkholderia ubonensis]